MKNRIALSLLLSSLCSCAATTHYAVDVNGFAGPAGAGLTSYAIESPRADEDPLLWAEFATYVERAMEKRGWHRAGTAEAADFVLVVDYGISGPEEYTYTTQTPVYGVTGETTTTGTTYNSYSGYQTTTTTTPQYGITHYDTGTSTGVRYYRHLDLAAFGRDALGNVEELPAWQTRMRSSGWSHDLRQIFPVMLAAATPYLGRSTGKEVKVALVEGDPSIAEITGAE